MGVVGRTASIVMRPSTVKGYADPRRCKPGRRAAYDPGAVDGDDLVRRLREGDEAAFAVLVRRHQGALLRRATSLVPNRAVAEEVVQDTWLAVVRGIGGFEGRSSVRTWLFRIVANRARTAGAREHRSVPVDPTVEPAVPPGRFGTGGPWSAPPVAWTDESDERVDARAVAARLTVLVPRLPDAQRRVFLLRDVEHLAPADVCDVLDLTAENERVLLHRARSRLRDMLHPV